MPCRRIPSLAFKQEACHSLVIGNHFQISSLGPILRNTAFVAFPIWNSHIHYGNRPGRKNSLRWVLACLSQGRSPNSSIL